MGCSPETNESVRPSFLFPLLGARLGSTCSFPSFSGPLTERGVPVELVREFSMNIPLSNTLWRRGYIAEDKRSQFQCWARNTATWVGHASRRGLTTKMGHGSRRGGMRRYIPAFTSTFKASRSILVVERTCCRKFSSVSPSTGGGCWFWSESFSFFFFLS